jgi:nucleoside-diphosphate-sugar epimerase
VRSVARGPLAPHPKLEHTRADVRDDAARRALGGVDVVWHLASQVWRGRDQASVNVDGTANVLAARPGRAVLASSAAVYGAHPDNPLPLHEGDPARPNDRCAYAAQKLACEGMVRGAVAAAVVRLSAVLGPHADPRVARAVRGYRAVVPATAAPLALQFLDEDDAARGLWLAGTGAAEGTWNLAPPDWLDAPAVARISGGRVARLPLQAWVMAAEGAWRARALPFGADRACLLAGPLALDASRAGTDLGWSATRTSAEVLAAAVGR